MAVKPQDCLLRRTRVGFLDEKQMRGALAETVSLFASELCWEQEKTDATFRSEFQAIQRLEF